MVLALGRTNPLKNLPLTLAAWRALRGAAARAVPVRDRARARAARRACATWSSPSDEQVNELFNEATVFVQTSTHEGFALPPLEAMATGARGRLHRRARQPRLLRGRRELPDARARPPRRSAPRSRGCSPTPSCASALGRAGIADGAGLRVGAADRRARGVLQAGGRGAADGGSAGGRRSAAPSGG